MEEPKKRKPRKNPEQPKKRGAKKPMTVEEKAEAREKRRQELVANPDKYK